MLRITNLEKTFFPNTQGENRVINSLNLTVEKGDFVTVVGSNGAGKSTLLNCISGDLPVNKGRIELAGQDVTNLRDYQRAGTVGRVFQDPLAGTAPEMTIEENLSLAFHKCAHFSLRRGITSGGKAAFQEVLSRLDMNLSGRLGVRVSMLSGGQRQALTLLMATISNPGLLLLDEHTAALDPAMAIKINLLTEEIIQEKNLTTLMVTHNLDDAIRMGDRLIMMDEGRIILDISGREKKKMTVEKLLHLFKERKGRSFNSDRSLFAVWAD
ncbi:MAG: ATP-binding cassette domain-containing protein [Halanaerobium sp.]|nr:ATP-binding cassette domain-containing protein [Halanaerobium sp.]